MCCLPGAEICLGAVRHHSVAMGLQEAFDRAQEASGRGGSCNMARCAPAVSSGSIGGAPNRGDYVGRNARRGRWPYSAD